MSRCSLGARGSVLVRLLLLLKAKAKQCCWGAQLGSGKTPGCENRQGLCLEQCALLSPPAMTTTTMGR